MQGLRARLRRWAPVVAMILHQTASQFGWLAGESDLDPVVTMDDATSEIYSAFLVEEDGTAKSFRARQRTCDDRPEYVRSQAAPARPADLVSRFFVDRLARLWAKK